MNRKGWIAFLALLVSFLFSYSQTAPDSGSVPQPYYLPPKPFPAPPYPASEPDSSQYAKIRIMSPIIGAGPGVLTFYGDVNDRWALAPSLSRMGYHLTASQYLSRSVAVNFSALYGKLSANEHGPRYLNFESTIRSAGINVMYNFDNLLPMKRRIDPFILIGIEALEFLSKADLFDATGNKYYYWKDGSIKNIDQNDPNAFSAIPLNRDYVYETDLRTWNKSYFGKYPERTFAVPAGAGFNMYLTDRFSFRMGATMHFTFTDYIDGTSDVNKANGAGDTKNDKYLETYFTLTFNLFNPKPEFISPLSDEEFLALANEDSDGDGVIDFNDSCQGTPPGVPVDKKGCPADSDKDGIPDYADKEPNSPAGAFVDSDGAALDDSTIAQKWRVWSDTTGLFNLVVLPVAIAGDIVPDKRTGTYVYRKELTVWLASYKTGVPNSEMEKLLNVPDINCAIHADSSTTCTAGTFFSKSAAEKRKDELMAAGFKDAKVMLRNKDGTVSELSSEILSSLPPDKAGTSSSGVSSSGAVFRVQLGAYSKKLSSSVFKGAGQVVEIKGDDGLYKYMSGSYISVQDALNHRENLLKRGYKGAFVVAFKEGRRVPLSSVSGGVITDVEEPKKSSGTVDKNLVYLSVQVGAFSGEPSAEVMQTLSEIPGLQRGVKPNGMIFLTAGKFKTLEEAQKFKAKVVDVYNIDDAFLVAFFKEQQITVQEAVELLK
jgi:hypothetical protein